MGALKRILAFRNEEKGSVAIIVAAFGLGLVATLAIGVDVANVYLARRSQQGSLDLAALSAARNLATAETSARASLASNGVGDIEELKVTLGRYDPDNARDAAARFVAGKAPFNAVQLDLKRSAPIHFGKSLLGGATPKLVSRSVAANTRIAAFTIGSKLVGLDGGLANKMLSALVGSNVSLSVSDYDALATATVDMPDFLRAVPGRTGASAATYDDVISTRPTVGEFAGALSDASSGGGVARLALSRIAQAGSPRRVALSRVVSVGPFGKLALDKQTGVSATVSVLDAMFTGLGVANGGSQVSLDLGLQVPSLLGLDATIDIGERPQSSPWLAMGPENVSVRTAQMRVRLTATAAAPLGLASVKLPIAVEAAAAVGTLTAARCGANPKTDAQATLDVTPTIVEAWVGEPKRPADWSNLALRPDVGPAVLLDTLLVRATASAHVASTNTQARSLTYSAADILKRTTKTVATSDASQTTLASLVGDLSVTATLKPLGLALGTPAVVSGALQTTLRPLGATLDPVANAALKLVGVSLGEAHVTVTGLRCDGSTLVM